MAVSITSPTVVLTGDPLIDEARQRLDWVIQWEGTWRPRFLDDIRFADGDSDNNNQWPNEIRQTRDIDKRPCLTINIVRQHNLQIMNQARKNKSTAKIMGTGNGATQESANAFKWIIERIQYQSNAQEAYTTGREFQIKGGIGWWRIVTDYYDSNSFDQDIFIRRIPDPLSVYMDSDCKERDCSDARYAFVFSTMTKEEFLEEFPGKETLATMQPLGVRVNDLDVRGDNHVRVCEYFRKVFEKDELISFIDPADGQRKSRLKSKMTPNIVRDLKKDEKTLVRDVSRPVIEWKLIAGEEVIDETEWPGKYIPLVRVIGEEVIVDGILDRKGHTRAMKSAQRMYNFNASAQVEFVALQSKVPWIAPAKAIEELETYWNTANIQNYSVLPWNHVDDENPDRPIPPPFRQEPPNVAPGFQIGMDTAFNQLMMASGQWQNQMGMMGNERTGEAIARRQEQSDTSVFHFEDNYGEALRYTYKQLIDLIPKIYDTRRVMQIFGDDGVDMEMKIDPTLRQAYVQRLDVDNNVIERIFNPSVGQYDVAADIGPDIGTRRQSTVDALTLILTQAPALTGIIGDLLLKSMDFDEAQEASLRLRRMIPPQALGQGPTQHEQQLMQQISQYQNALEKVTQKLGISQAKLVGKDEMREIDVYKAETDRLNVLVDGLQTSPDQMKQVVQQLVEETLTTHLGHILADHQEGNEEDSIPPMTKPPHPAARQGNDGAWYIMDPTRQYKYLRLEPLARQHDVK